MGRVITTTVFTVVGIAAGFFAARWIKPTESDPSHEIKMPVPVSQVIAEGRILPIDGIRMVTTLPGRRIADLKVELGSPTKKGQTELCVMADEPLLKMQWELAKSRKEDFKEEIRQKIIAAELNRASAEAALKEAKLNQSRLQSDSPESSYVDQKIHAARKKLDRLKELAEAEKTAAFVSSQDIFEQELELEKTIAEKQGLKQAAELAVETARKTLELADKALESAKSAGNNSRSLDLAESIARQQYENGRVLAPADGEVVRIHVRPGDTVGNFPLLEIADCSRMVVEAEVYFANLPRIIPGKHVTISSPVFPADLTGKVLSKSQYVGSGSLMSANPLARVDQEVAKVIVEIDPKHVETAKNYLNLQVTVTIDIE